MTWSSQSRKSLALRLSTPVADDEGEVGVEVAVDVAADQEVAVGRGLDPELAGVGEGVVADEAEFWLPSAPGLASIGRRSIRSSWAREKSSISSGPIAGASAACRNRDGAAERKSLRSVPTTWLSATAVWFSSKAPMSGLVPAGCGRTSPRWSVAGASAGSAPASAGLSAASRRAMVWVGPPLSASPPANSRLAGTFSRSPGALPSTSLPKMLWPLLAVMPPATSGSVLPVAVLPATMLLRRRRIQNADAEIPPPSADAPAVLLPLTVLLVSDHAADNPARRSHRRAEPLTRRAVAADRAVGQRHVDRAVRSVQIPPPGAGSPAVLLPLTVLLVSVTLKPRDPAAPDAFAPVVLLPLTVLLVSVSVP